MRTSDKLRLRLMEKEIADCWVDRYYKGSQFDGDDPDIREMRKEMFDYLEGPQVNGEIPTYYHYWDDDDYRRRLWLLEQDPIARGMLTRITTRVHGIIDGRTTGRLKRVGDGSHKPAENKCEGLS